MDDFKLLAIRPLSGCNPKYLKMLDAGEFYKFYNGVSFTHHEKNYPEVLTISYKSDVPDNFYSVSDKDSKPGISISAIVGKNGTGKSSIIELLFVAIYNFAFERNMLKKVDRSHKLESEHSIRVEIYYQFGGTIYCLSVDSWANRMESIPTDQYCQVYEYKSDGDNLFFYNRCVSQKDKVIYPYFFYTIAVNYSIYGLNSVEIGDWIKSLFHKNDGYQTPIVINPFRDKGNIDIQTENELVKQRLLANILEPVPKDMDQSKSLRNLAEGKTAIALWLTLRSNIGYLSEVRKTLKNIETADAIVEKLFERYTGHRMADISKEHAFEVTKSYILYKLVRMCKKYNRYKKFFKARQFINGDSLITNVINDGSHVAFKIKQALNFLRYRLNLTERNRYIYERISIQSYSEFIGDTIKEELKKGRVIRTIELIPPSIYDIDIRFDDSHSFSDLSSGEKQKIHGISSIVYHLINLNSVFKNGELLLGKNHNEYKYVNIIFDEIELYYHPDLQRNFINDLVEYIGKVNKENIEHIESINMIFVTHSPFILSDIPSNNVMYLEVNDLGKSRQVPSKNQSFGANVHDLLANDFFMKDGFMGEWVKKKIQDAIAYMESCRELRLRDQLRDQGAKMADTKAMINLIGEPMIRKSMYDLYFSAFGEEELDKEINRLLDLRRRGIQ